MISLFEIGKNKYNTDVYSIIVCRLIDDYLSDNSLFSLKEVAETHNLLKRLICDNINFPLSISNFDNWVFIFNSKINNFVDEYLSDLIVYKYNYVTPDKIGERKNIYTENETKNGAYKTGDTSTSNSTNASTTESETTSNSTNASTTESETTENSTSYNSDYPNQNISKENITAYASNSVYAETETTSSSTINDINGTTTTSGSTINGTDATTTTSGSTINSTDETTTTNSGTRNEDINTSRERTETFNDLTPIEIYNDLLIKMKTIYTIFKNEMDILWIREF